MDAAKALAIVFFFVLMGGALWVLRTMGLDFALGFLAATVVWHLIFRFQFGKWWP